MQMALNRKDIRTAQNGVSLEHRHFAFIAAALRASKPLAMDSEEAGDAGAVWLNVVERFANECRATNPKFNRARFLAACGWEG